MYRGGLLYFAVLTPRRRNSSTPVRCGRCRGNRRPSAAIGRCRRYCWRGWCLRPHCGRRRLHRCLRRWLYRYVRYGLYPCARCRLPRCRCCGLRLRRDWCYAERAAACVRCCPCLPHRLLCQRRSRHGATRRRYGQTCSPVGLDGGRSMSLRGGASCYGSCWNNAGRMSCRFCWRYRRAFRRILLRISCAHLGQIAFAVQKRLHRWRGYGTHWCHARWARRGRLYGRARAGRPGNRLLRCTGGSRVAWEYLFGCARHGSGRLYRRDGQSGRDIRSVRRHDRSAERAFRLRCTQPSEVRRQRRNLGRHRRNHHPAYRICFRYTLVLTADAADRAAVLPIVCVN